MAKSASEKIATLKARQEKLAAQLNALTAKAKQEDRKRDARRKIVIGGAILAAIENDPSLAEMISLALALNVTRPADLEVIADLLERSNTSGGGASRKGA